MQRGLGLAKIAELANSRAEFQTWVWLILGPMARNACSIKDLAGSGTVQGFVRRTTGNQERF